MLLCSSFVEGHLKLKQVLGGTAQACYALVWGLHGVGTEDLDKAQICIPSIDLACSTILAWSSTSRTKRFEAVKSKLPALVSRGARRSGIGRRCASNVKRSTSCPGLTQDIGKESHGNRWGTVSMGRSLRRRVFGDPPFD